MPPIPPVVSVPPLVAPPPPPVLVSAPAAEVVVVVVVVVSAVVAETSFLVYPEGIGSRALPLRKGMYLVIFVLGSSYSSIEKPCKGAPLYDVVFTPPPPANFFTFSFPSTVAIMSSM